MILPRHLTASEIATDLRMSKRRVVAMMEAGAFGPVLRIGPKTRRVTRGGYERYLNAVTGQTGRNTQ